MRTIHKKINEYRKKAQTMNSSLDNYLEFAVCPTRQKVYEYEKECSNLDWNVRQLILEYFFKSGREYILRETLLQENNWKYLICLNNQDKLLNDFFNSLNADEQIDMYLIIVTHIIMKTINTLLLGILMIKYFQAIKIASAIYVEIITNWQLICYHEISMKLKKFLMV